MLRQGPPWRVPMLAVTLETAVVRPRRQVVPMDAAWYDGVARRVLLAQLAADMRAVAAKEGPGDDHESCG